MTFSFGLTNQFATEFARFPESQQDKVLDFATTFQNHGLSDFTKYVGKIAPSWSGAATAHDAKFAKDNHLWHYHIGLPSYTQLHPKYKTSDWVLHFRWIDRGDHIDLVDLYSHYRHDGTFYLPNSSCLL